MALSSKPSGCRRPAWFMPRRTSWPTRPSRQCSTRVECGPSRAISGRLGVTTVPGAAMSLRRGHSHATALLGSCRGILQCNGYKTYQALAGTRSADPSITLAFCWSHVPRGFYDLVKTKAPIAMGQFSVESTATAPSTCSENMPCGVVVSTGARRLRKCAPAPSSSSMTASRWLTERARR